MGQHACFAAVAAGLVGIGGCATMVPADQREPVEIVRTVADGVHAARTEKGVIACRTKEAWASTWNEAIGRDKPPPDVDFDRRMVIVAFLGRRSTGGYAVRIDSVWRAAGAIGVGVKVRKPGPRSLVTQSLTSPCHAVVVPKQSGPVQATWRESDGE